MLQLLLHTGVVSEVHLVYSAVPACQAGHSQLFPWGCELRFAGAESPAAIKLMAGCVQQLRQAAQPHQPDMQLRCTCKACQLLQSFLAQPDQAQLLNLGSCKEAEHGIRSVQKYMVVILYNLHDLQQEFCLR